MQKGQSEEADLMIEPSIFVARYGNRGGQITLSLVESNYRGCLMGPDHQYDDDLQSTSSSIKANA